MAQVDPHGAYWNAEKQMYVYGNAGTERPDSPELDAEYFLQLIKNRLGESKKKPDPSKEQPVLSLNYRNAVELQTFLHRFLKDHPELDSELQDLRKKISIFLDGWR